MKLRYLLFCVTVAAVLAAAPAPGQALVVESALDHHVQLIADELRCLVCQGQTVADSNSSLAADMRAKIREKLKQGWSDRQIHEFFIARYGDFVLYRPPLEASTWALWFGPPALLAFALTGLIVYLRQRARRVAPAALTAEDRRQARLLLAPHKKDGL